MKNQLPDNWQELWEKQRYQTPTLIQEKMFEPLTSNQSVLGISPTGSGKTVAYLLPLLAKLVPNEGNQLLILLPSQELAAQVAEVTRLWAKPLNLNVQTILGGANLRRQVEGLKKKRPEIVIGTPGRVLELIKTKRIKAHLIKTLVLDEIDDLVAQTEYNAAKSIIKSMQKDIQIVGVSATGQAVIPELDHIFISEPLIIDVTKEDTTKGTIKHAYILTPSRKRSDVLRRLVHTPNFKALVFFNQVSELGAVSERMDYFDVSHATLASDQHQTERKAAIKDFENNRLPLLLTTDIGARGLDFSDLYYVVQHDVPLMAENYVHRAGRVGRMGKDGMVISLVNERELRNLRQIMREIDRELIEVFAAHGQILTERPTDGESEVETEVLATDVLAPKTVKPKSRPAKSASKVTNKQPDTPVKPKKKKNRTKKQKNKGVHWNKEPK
ncbi:hypothetical protein CBF34_02590 [Vagococcus penaei]|uniref:Uncharacterized protein n=1 Tax=Vagococcus penaei TaxID=633807 RepID=A0A1Q2D403_9ENTE|nr:DEAD/DEAH box helicase [Vagococcus penaei]AQP53120.1 hypothetical protein BW732_02000 [Vagococcus penaei]RSU06018.1 hypothetical protein CBF34_02590 [Vagococcus penaei]